MGETLRERLRNSRLKLGRLEKEIMPGSYLPLLRAETLSKIRFSQGSRLCFPTLHFNSLWHGEYEGNYEQNSEGPGLAK